MLTIPRPDTTLTTVTGPANRLRPGLASTSAVLRVGWCVLLVGACSFDAAGARPDDPSPTGDAGDPDDAGDPGDADANPPGQPQPHLLLSEVNPRPVEREFIEIFNPGGEPVDLSDYYLSDDQDYARLPALTGSGTAPDLLSFDFIVQFPDGATIEPGQVIVVALRFDDFEQAFGSPPDYAILQGQQANQMRAIIVVDGEPTITDSGEGVVLFFWDGASDLVRDVDMVPAGNAIDSFNQLADKTMISVDGPDNGGNATRYAPDAFTIGEIAADIGQDQSYKRIAREDGRETQAGEGNGLTGHDETSENVTETWDGPGTFSAPTPGEIPASLANP